MDQFNKICKDIKEVKIQGATNIARAGIKALKLKSDRKSIKKLLSLRPTEPCLYNAIQYAKKHDTKKAMQYLNKADKIITTYGTKLIKRNDIIYTHCHSGTVLKILAASKNKNITVYNTETRPLYQGRITSKELAKLKIKNIHLIDSAMRLAIKKADIILLGTDAITKTKIYNKIGSELIAETAKRYKTPIYICTNSWKFDKRSITKKETPLEKRNPKEIWKNPPKNIQIYNPAFEKQSISPLLI